MSDIDGFLYDVRRYLTAGPSERLYNKTALKDRMKYMQQEELIEALRKMNLVELRHCMGCGIPGFANSEAILMIRVRKKEYDKYMEWQKRQPILPKDVAEKLESEGYTFSVDPATSTADPVVVEEEIDHAEQAIHAFESGRERDS